MAGMLPADELEEVLGTLSYGSARIRDVELLAVTLWMLCASAPQPGIHALLGATVDADTPNQRRGLQRGQCLVLPRRQHLVALHVQSLSQGSGPAT